MHQGSGDGFDRVGAVVAGFELVSELDRGGRSAVFEARARPGETELRPDGDVAVKVYPAAPPPTPVALEEARRVARVARELSDPGLCAVHEIGDHHGVPYAIERLVDGEPLHETLDDARRTYPISVDEVLRFVERACGALHGAHQVGLVHGDLRPSKVLVDEDGLPVVLDLGLSRVLAGGEDLHEAPFYRAPEVLRGGVADARSDVYSLGAMLYELLTLRRPYDAPTREALLARLDEAPAPDLLRADRRFSPNLAAVVATALAHDPDERYQAAADLAADLRAVRERRSVSVETSKRPFGAAALLLLVLLASGVSGLAGFLAGRAPIWTAQRADEARREFRRALVADPAAQGERERDALRTLLAMEPENDLARVTLAVGMLLHAREVDAISLVEAAPDGADASAMTRVRAAALSSAGREAEAADAAAELGPPGSFADSYAAGVLALTAFGLGGPEQAAEHLLRAALLTPAPELPVLAALGRAAAATGDVEDARFVADALVTHFPNSAAAWGSVARLRELAGDDAEALAACDEVLSRDPENAETHERRVRLLLEADDADAAAEAFEDGLDELDDLGAFRLRVVRGQTLVRDGQLEDGLAALEEALAAVPEGAAELATVARLAAALALVELGRGDEAMRYLRPVLEGDPQHAEASALFDRAMAVPVD